MNVLTMNIERMTILAEMLEKGTELPVKFNMAFFLGHIYTTGRDETNVYPLPDTVAGLFERAYDCGTTACMGGLACLLFAEGNDRHVKPNYVTAAKLLGLTDLQARLLFFNGFWEGEPYVGASMDEITPAMAASAIRKMIANPVAHP